MGVTVVHLTAGHLPDKLLAVPTNMTLTVRGKPIITEQPTNLTALAGGLATFSVITTALPPPSFRWRTNGLTLTGETNATLTLSNITTANVGGYTVVVSNLVGSVTSVVATLTVSTVAPVGITMQPMGRTVVVGDPVTLSLVATGSPPITYQWKKGGTSIPDATNARLPFASAALTDTGDYSAVISNPAGPLPSQAAHLAVLPLPRFSSTDLSGSDLILGFTRESGAAYEILHSDALPAVLWGSLTNFPVSGTSALTFITNSTDGSSSRFFRIRMTIP